MDETARLHPNSWSSVEVRVLDISPNGFRAQCEARVLVGSAVSLEVDGVGPVRAHITWRCGDRLGAQFDHPADMGSCTWTPVCDQVVLARMLLDRARARSQGAYGEELELRRKILEALPTRPIRGAEPGRSHP